MQKFIERHAVKMTMAVLVSGMFLACPAHAADPSAESKSGAAMKQQSGQERVEMRIKTLHDKLGVTSAQEQAWAAVAEVMRGNEAIIHKLVEARHENEAASAVDDLKSYESIADAHADGLKNLIPVFESFYKDLSDKQKANADDLFGKFEGHEGHKGNEGNEAAAPPEPK